MRWRVGVMAAVLTLPQMALAQVATESWDSLSHLRPGQEIEVVRMNVTRLKGTFLGSSRDALVLRVKQDSVSVPRNQVLRVTGESKKLRNALIGMAIGAAGGLALGYGADCSRMTERCSGLAAFLIGLPVGAGAGAAVGATVTRRPTIYRAPPGAPVEPIDSVAAGMWERLGAVSPVGVVEVRLKHGEMITARLAGVSATALTLSLDAQTTEVNREEVFQVYRLVRKATVPTLLGVGIGFATAGLNSLVLDEIFVNAPEASMFAIAPAIGGALGYALGRRTKRILIYDAEIANTSTTPG